MMKRILSVEDLFGKSDSDADSDQTQELSPQKIEKKQSSSSQVDLTNSDSKTLQTVKTNSEMACRGNLKKSSSTEQSGKCHEISDDDSNDESGKRKKSYGNNETKSSGTSKLDCLKSGEIKPKCQYGRRCYRKNPSHFKEYDHPDGTAPVPAKRQRTSSETDGASGQSQSASSSISGADIVERSQPFSFLLTKVCGIERKFNSVLSIGFKDVILIKLSARDNSVMRFGTQGIGKCPYRREEQVQNMARIHHGSSEEIYYVQVLDFYRNQLKSQPLLVVHGAKGEEKTSLQEEASQYGNIRLCQAPLEITYGTHHTKMMLLLYESGLRVVIHTANLIERDWYQKSQGVWVSPLFTRLPSESASAGDSATHFKRDLLEYLGAYRQRALDEWMATIRQFDMSSAKVVLIGSVPGRHVGEKKSHFGHLKLKKVLQESGPDSKVVSGWSVIGQFSSVGSLGASSDVWLTSEWLSSLSSAKGASAEKAKLQLVFPSKENVRCSLEGYPAGASIPYSIHTARRQPFFNTYLHQWKSSRRGRSRAAPHIKTYARSSPDGTRLGWCLVTSANMSKAAWGALEKNGTQLLTRSYELGVLFLPCHFDVDSFVVADLTSYEKQEEKSCPFPFPFDLPPTPYGRDDKPWIWDVPYTDKPDSNGNIWSPS